MTASESLPAQGKSKCVEFAGVDFGFRGGSSPLLRQVSFSLNFGEAVLLSGANGSGKSSLLGLASGRLLPDSGTVRVFGQNPARIHRAPDIGLVVEPFHPDHSPLPPGMSAAELLHWVHVLDGAPRQRADEALQELQLPRNLLSRPLQRLSKGERQRVALLLVVLRNPRLILADEPLEGIDAKSRHILESVLAGHARRGGGAMLWVSHHVGEASEHVDRCLVIEDGTLREAPLHRFDVQLIVAGREQEFRSTCLATTVDRATSAFGDASSIQLRISRCPEPKR